MPGRGVTPHGYGAPMALPARHAVALEGVVVHLGARWRSGSRPWTCCPSPSVPATKGTLVHLALEHLFAHEAPDRTLDAALSDLAHATEELRTDPDFTGLALDAAAEAAFLADADRLVRTYFTIEDPAAVHPVGLELMLEASIDDIRIRGIIDRLELDPQGGLVVTDYRTGRSPHVSHQQGRLGGVAFYSLLCQELFGVLPSKVQLLYLGDGLTIATEPTEQSIRGLHAKLRALWQAMRACGERTSAPSPGRSAAGAPSRPTARPRAATSHWPRPSWPSVPPSRLRLPRCDRTGAPHARQPASAIDRFDDRVDALWGRDLPWPPAGGPRLLPRIRDR